MFDIDAVYFYFEKLLFCSPTNHGLQRSLYPFVLSNLLQLILSFCIAYSFKCGYCIGLISSSLFVVGCIISQCCVGLVCSRITTETGHWLFLPILASPFINCIFCILIFCESQCELSKFSIYCLLISIIIHFLYLSHFLAKITQKITRSSFDYVRSSNAYQIFYFALNLLELQSIFLFILNFGYIDYDFIKNDNNFISIHTNNIIWILLFVICVPFSLSFCHFRHRQTMKTMIMRSDRIDEYNKYKYSKYTQCLAEWIIYKLIATYTDGTDALWDPKKVYFSDKTLSKKAMIHRIYAVIHSRYHKCNDLDGYLHTSVTRLNREYQEIMQYQSIESQHETHVITGHKYKSRICDEYQFQYLNIRTLKDRWKYIDKICHQPQSICHESNYNFLFMLFGWIRFILMLYPILWFFSVYIYGIHDWSQWVNDNRNKNEHLMVVILIIIYMISVIYFCCYLFIVSRIEYFYGFVLRAVYDMATIDRGKWKNTQFCRSIVELEQMIVFNDECFEMFMQFGLPQEIVHLIMMYHTCIDII
eukprot:319343_1